MTLMPLFPLPRDQMKLPYFFFFLLSWLLRWFGGQGVRAGGSSATFYRGIGFAPLRTDQPETAPDLVIGA